MLTAITEDSLLSAKTTFIKISIMFILSNKKNRAKDKTLRRQNGTTGEDVVIH